MICRYYSAGIRGIATCCKERTEKSLESGEKKHVFVMYREQLHHITISHNKAHSNRWWQ